MKLRNNKSFFSSHRIPLRTVSISPAQNCAHFLNSKNDGWWLLLYFYMENATIKKEINYRADLDQMCCK